MTTTGRERWFADLLSGGIEMGIMTEADVLAHATPTVLAAALPRELMVKMLDVALGVGTISPAAVMKTATPELIAKHVAPAVVWNCIAAVAKRAGIADGKSSATTEGAREFLRHGLAVGLEVGVITPADITRHVDARVLGTHLTDDLTAQLLEAALASGKMTPTLVIDTLGLDEIVRYAPSGIVWACFAQAAEGMVQPVLAEGSLRNASANDDPVILVVPDEPPPMRVKVPTKPPPKSPTATDDDAHKAAKPVGAAKPS